MSNPVVSNLSKRAPIGDRFMVTATLTWATYAQAAADKVTAASLGLVYIDSVDPSPSSVAGVDCLWDGVKGASAGLTLNDEDNTSGVSADATAGARTDVVYITVLGY
jgi:hypothetical protein